MVFGARSRSEPNAGWRGAFLVVLVGWFCGDGLVLDQVGDVLLEHRDRHSQCKQSGRTISQST